MEQVQISAEALSFEHPKRYSNMRSSASNSMQQPQQQPQIQMPAYKDQCTGEIQSLTMYKKKNAEAALNELLMKKNPKKEDEEFLLGEVDKYDRRLELVKHAIEKASAP
ncbi:unnamed protein product [Rotaria sp. Silwood2]|nr:unnamed protein product [Rotaria sp. Silwood2]CAF4602494.1 unnamed protein product [Rotaria sp. Silwood2]